MDGNLRNTLPKKERLCGKTAISRLLAKGKHGNVPGLRYLCMAGTDAGVNRIMVSVPKKFFKRAVKRNLLKRRIRESWRKQKHMLTVTGGVDILFMYPTKEILSFEDIYSAVGKVIQSLNDRYPVAHQLVSEDSGNVPASSDSDEACLSAICRKEEADVCNDQETDAQVE